MNDSKTQFMTNLVIREGINLNGSKVELVNSYKFLGHGLRIGRDNQTCEITRRIELEQCVLPTCLGRI